MGLNIDSSVKTNKPIIINKKKGLERQTERHDKRVAQALNDYNSIREKIDNSLKGGICRRYYNTLFLWGDP